MFVNIYYYVTFKIPYPASMRKTAPFEGFCRPWVYIPESTFVSVGGLLWGLWGQFRSNPFRFLLPAEHSLKAPLSG